MGGVMVALQVSAERHTGEAMPGVQVRILPHAKQKEEVWSF